jgi:hypothetical protein
MGRDHGRALVTVQLVWASVLSPSSLSALLTRDEASAICSSRATRSSSTAGPFTDQQGRDVPHAATSGWDVIGQAEAREGVGRQEGGDLFDLGAAQGKHRDFVR